MRRGLSNILKFTISVTLGMLFSYVGFSFVLWNLDVTSWGKAVRAMCALFGVLAGGPFFAMLFPDKENKFKDRDCCDDDVY